MLATQRSHSSRHAPISYPLSPQNSPPQGFDSHSPMSAKTTTRHPRRPSLSSPMSWLSRNSSSASQHAPYTPATKPVRISEPKLSKTLDSLAHTRNRSLGTGAVVVRTPQEALAGSGVTVDVASDPEMQEQDSEDSDIPEEEEEEEAESNVVHLNSPPSSPSLPPLPISKSSPTLPLRESPTQPAKPSRPPPPAPASTDSSPRSSLKHRSPSHRSPSPLPSFFPGVPPLPAHLALPPPPPPPPFDCILLSSVPTNAIDMSKIIVTLETCTATHRTTLTTLTSRPSHLANYLKSLFRSYRDSAASLQSQTSEYAGSPDTAFNSIFHQHLASSGLLPQSATNVHLFLDRPSAPYDHILTYLRSPPATIDHIPALPHAVQLHTTTTPRIEALVALRDEARYLGLDDLHKLCVDELRTRPATRIRGGSIRSTHTVRDQLSPRSSHESARDTGSPPRGGGGAIDARRTSPSDLAAALHHRLAGREQGGELKREGSVAHSARSRPVGNWV